MKDFIKRLKALFAGGHEEPTQTALEYRIKTLEDRMTVLEEIAARQDREASEAAAGILNEWLNGV